MLHENQIIGSYRVLRLLGEGGMGAVYEVEHTELKTRYALKTFVYDSASDDQQLLRRKFFEEARILANLKHPNLINVFDLSCDEQRGLLYYVMDLVEGSEDGAATLADLSGEIDEKYLSKWFAELADVLDYIHDQGIVHRDIKLENVLITKDKHIQLADFGVSKILQGKLYETINPERTMRMKDSRGKSAVTVLGTDHYIAPEVQTGHTPSSASDAYSLGVMFARIFTGKWADMMTVADVEHELHGYRYRWYRVIPDLLNFDPEKRPHRLTPLVQLLDRVVGVQEPKKRVKAPPKKSSWPVVAQISAALFMLFAGVCFLLKPVNEKVVVVEVNREPSEPEAPKILTDEIPKAEPVARNVVKSVVEPIEEEAEKETEIIPAAEVEMREESGIKPEADEKPQAEADEKSQPKNQDSEPKAKDSADVEDVEPTGPIPKANYRWFKGQGNAKPQPVDFSLANGAKLAFIPVKPGVFCMANDVRDTQLSHKVTITRPFWVSKFLISVEELRDRWPKLFEECRKIEAAVASKGYTVSATLSSNQISAFCDYLTRRYGSQLPKGYVFRLMTDAENEYVRHISTENLRKQPSGWYHEYIYYSGGAREAFRETRAELQLDRVYSWFDDIKNTRFGGCSADGKYFIGGRMKEFDYGFHDIFLHLAVLFDRVNLKKIDYANDSYVSEPLFTYAQEERDPLIWASEEEPDARIENLRRDNSGKLFVTNPNARDFVFHLAVAPDLVGERAWEKSAIARKPKKRTHSLVVKPTSAQWNPKKKIDAKQLPLESSFELDNGAVMTFCYCPEGPFWITKWNVTAEQWRDFGPWDCEDEARELEKFFKPTKWPVSVKRSYPQWKKYCAYLTGKYAKILPKGYVFRPATERELSLAMEGTTKDAKSTLLSDVLKRHKFDDPDGFKRYGMRGVFRDNCFVGGRETPGKFGAVDFACNQVCADLYDADIRVEPDKLESKANGSDAEVVERETSDNGENLLCRYDGIYGNYYLARFFDQRKLVPHAFAAYAHLVVAPDCFTELDENDAASYPKHLFGGNFLGGNAKVRDMSTRSRNRNNHERLLSLERVKTADLLRGDACLETEKEVSPWAIIELDKVYELSGLQIVADRNSWRLRHLRVQLSEDGKIWHTTLSRTSERRRYGFDLRTEKGVATRRAMFIRISREPKFQDERLSLLKVLVYGSCTP